jgi:hypothetical protein
MLYRFERTQLDVLFASVGYEYAQFPKKICSFADLLN